MKELREGYEAKRAGRGNRKGKDSLEGTNLVQYVLMLWNATLRSSSLSVNSTLATLNDSLDEPVFYSSNVFRHNAGFTG